MNCRRLAKKHAFSLLETVVVAGVVSLILIFTLGLIPSFKLANKRASVELHAGSLAQARLDQLRVVAFDDIAMATFPDVTLDGVTFQSEVFQSEIVTKGTPPQEIAKRVRVEISWTWKEQKQKTFRETKLCRILRS